MNRVKIVICGKEYTLQTDESPEYIYGLVKELEKRFSEIVADSTTISTSSAGIMLSLSILDELNKNNESANRLRSQVKEYVDEAGKAKMERDSTLKELEIVRGKLEQMEENLKLKKLGESIKK